MRFGDDDVITVSALNALVRSLVEAEYPDVSVLGEVSNFKRHSSGHLYFTLKDSGGQLRAVCFRGVAGRLRLDLGDGVKVVVRGRLTIYEPYGQYQIVAADVQEAGEGELERAFRALKERLAAEGLFDEARKRSLPPYPMKIAVVTSPTGAAIRDVISTVERRWPCAEVLVVPVRVQGEQAAAEIVRALKLVADAGDVDVAIVGRGGGSLEDLWAFNEEAVARAIYECPVPVVSAVGHETDFTIADFVADVRAATPTMAAEIVVPRRDEMIAAVEGLLARLGRAVTTMASLRSARLQELLGSYALGRVRGRIEAGMQTLDYLWDRLGRAALQLVGDRRAALDSALVRLRASNPREILARGYTICTDAATGTLLRRVDEALAAGTVAIRFSDGSVTGQIKERRDVG